LIDKKGAATIKSQFDIGLGGFVTLSSSSDKTQIIANQKNAIIFSAL
jgi:hypothetical protein